jgi:uncharacterized protein DUF4157
VNDANRVDKMSPARAVPLRASPWPGRTTLVEQADAIQRKATGDAPAAGVDAAVASASSSGGAPVDSNMRERVESSTGAQLSNVSVHTGPESNAAADALGTRAYTSGNQIHFASGQYAPATPDGQHLIAHELAHTVQQRGGSGLQAKGRVSEPGDAAEGEADRIADAVLSGGHSGPIQHGVSPPPADRDLNVIEIPTTRVLAAGESISFDVPLVPLRLRGHYGDEPPAPARHGVTTVVCRVGYGTTPIDPTARANTSISALLTWQKLGSSQPLHMQFP